MSIVTFDRPGYGRSDPHKTRTLKTYADDLISLADALGIPHFFLVGVSGGGAYSLATAHKYPERVRGICLLGSVGSKGDHPCDYPHV
jgi:pimeloyl-ACP methyl ester carboxylesterase